MTKIIKSVAVGVTAFCIATSAVAEIKEDDGLVDQVKSTLGTWKQNIETYQAENKANKLESAYVEARNALAEFNSAIDTIHQKSLNLSEGKLCGPGTADVYASVASNMRALAASFGKGGKLLASLEGALLYNKHQQSILNTGNAPAAAKSRIAQEYTNQGERISNSIAKVNMWYSKLAEMESKVLGQSELSIHYCVLKQTELLLDEVDRLFSEIEKESEKIGADIDKMQQSPV